MNKVFITGRLTRDPEVRYGGSNNDLAIARYSLAVDRRYKRDGEQSADFVPCVCFGKSAQFAEKYLKKGTKIAVVGSLRSGSYEKDGRKVFTLEVIAEEHEFCESRQGGNSAKPADGFESIGAGLDDSLPFN